MKGKIIKIVMAVLLVFSSTITIGIYKVDAGYTAVIKTMTSTGKNMFKSMSKRSGKELDAEQFKKQDGSVDWDAYEKAEEDLGNSFFSHLQQGIGDASGELVNALKGDTSIITKTPLKNLPGWAKTTISTAAFASGVDLLYGVYDCVSSSCASDFLNTFNNKLITYTDVLDIKNYVNNDKTVVLNSETYPAGQLVQYIRSGAPVNVNLISYAAVERMGWKIERLVGYENNQSYISTHYLIHRTGTTTVMTARLDYLPQIETIAFNENFTTMNIITKPPNEVKAYYFNSSQSLRSTYYGTGYGYKTFDDVVNAFKTTGFTNSYYTPIHNGPFSKIIVDNYNVNSYITSDFYNKDEVTLIVPDGNLSDEQISKVEEQYPDIMKNPEKFLEDYPEFSPDEKEDGKEYDKEFEENLDLEDESSWTVLGILKSVMKRILGIGKAIINFVVPDLEVIVEQGTRLKDLALGTFPIIGQAREILSVLENKPEEEVVEKVQTYSLKSNEVQSLSGIDTTPSFNQGWEGIKANVPFVEEELTVVSPEFINVAGRTMKSFISFFMILMMVIYIIKRSDGFFKR